MSLSLFARLTKVDEEKRLVYGRATEEVVDRSGEIMDYATSKPYFEKWSGDVAKATDGKSVGNLRAMHANIAAGKLTGIDFLDEERAIDICAKVVDDAEWNKVLEGVYTGFSIGGDYVKRWADPDLSARRFTADPCEISLVDLPCVPTASFFSIEKADGSVMQKAFKAPPPVSSDEFSDEIAALAKAGDLTLDEMLAAIRLAKAKKEEGKYGDVEYADTANKKYPIDTEEHIRAAWSYINKEKDAAEYSADELKTVKDRIIAAWKDKIDKDGPPSAADKTVEPVLTKNGKPVVLSVDNLALAARLALHKGMYGVSTFANILGSISYLQQAAAREAATEDDGSTMPDELKAWLKQGGDLLAAMVAEEVAELVEDDGNVDCTSVYYFECAAAAENLHKAVAALGGEHLHESFAKALEKAGARNSGADLTRIQKAHDLLGELGAKCAKEAGEDDDMEAEKAAHAETLGKLTAAGESLAKLTADLATATARVATVEGELETLAKGVVLITGERDELQKKFDEQAALITKLKAEPANPKGVINGVGAAIAKSHDFTVGVHEQEDVEPVLNPDGSVNEAATEIKKARRNGGVIVFRG